MNNGSERPESQAEQRDQTGRFLPGNASGEATRFPPGQSGNPSGRPSAGLSILEFVNVLQGSTEADLQVLARDKFAPVNKRIAAELWLRAVLPLGDLADFGSLLTGESDLAALRDAGVDTRIIKRVVVNEGKDGTRRITVELRDGIAESNFDKLLDRTVGRAVQRQEITVEPTRAPGDLLAEARRAAGLEVVGGSE
jgi:hypothetical protein